MKWHKEGRTEFNLEVLATLKLDEALKMFNKTPKTDVEKAWNKANPVKKKQVKKEE